MCKLIFLDMDGVLNDHSPYPNGYCGIKPECVRRLNWIVAETGAKIVLSSAWRYMIHNGAMTIDGFKYLLMIHGLAEAAEIIGITATDESVPGRGYQICAWLDRQFGDERASYVVIDDGSDLPPRHPETETLSESIRRLHAGQWVQTDNAVGLTDYDVVRAVEILSAYRLARGGDAPGGGVEGAA